MEKRIPSALLVGMEIGAVTVENSMEFPQKTKNGTAFQLGNSIAVIIPCLLYTSDAADDTCVV